MSFWAENEQDENRHTCVSFATQLRRCAAVLGFVDSAGEAANGRLEMDIEELKEEIAKGEDSGRQFKAYVTNPDSLAAEVVAMLNARGGLVFIGVDDNGGLDGLDADGVRRINQMISNVASQHIKNPVSLTTENIVLENSRVVIILHIPLGIDKPYFDKNGVIWLKEGADKRKVLSKEEIRRLFESSSSLHADEQPTRARLEEVDLLRFREFFEKTYSRKMPDSEAGMLLALKNMNLAVEDGRLNLAGLLMFGRHPEYIVPQFCVKAVRANGKDVSFMSFSDREEFSGTLQDMYDGTLAFLMRNIHKTQRRESVNYPGESEIPRVVFEEMLVNALVHRNYYVDAPIRIMMFDDRVEIISPGSLPNHLTVEKILAGNTNIRNPIIASYVARGILPYWGLGTGIGRVRAAWPDIDFIDDKDGVQFRVVIHKMMQSSTIVGGEVKHESGEVNTVNGEVNVAHGGAKAGGGEVKSESGEVSNTLGIDEKVYRAVVARSGIKRIELASITGVSVRSVERALSRLAKSGRIEYQGSDKTGGWFAKT